MQSGNLKALVAAKENASKSGLLYTFFAFFLVAAFVAATLIVMLIAGGSEKEVTSAVTNTDLYKFIAYSLSGAVAITVITISASTRKIAFKEFCGVKFPEKKYYLRAVLLFAGMMFGLSGINGYFIKFLIEHAGYNYTEPTLPTLTPINYILTVITVCIVPAVCEEFFFRGALLWGLKGGGKYSVALLNGLLFAAYHINPAQTLYQFAVGVTFTLLALDSGSSLLTAAIHFLNNFLVLNLGYFTETELTFGAAGDAIATVVGLVSVAAFIFLTVGDRRPNKGEFASKWLILKSFSVYALMGFVAFSVLWIAGLFS